MLPRIAYPFSSDVVAHRFLEKREEEEEVEVPPPLSGGQEIEKSLPLRSVCGARREKRRRDRAYTHTPHTHT